MNDSLTAFDGVRTPIRQIIRCEALGQLRTGSLDTLKRLHVFRRSPRIGDSPNPSLYYSCEGDTIGEHRSPNPDTMSVTPVEYRNTNIVTSTPIIPTRILSKNINFDRTIFNVAKCRKVELHDLSPKVHPFNGERVLFLPFIR